MHIAAHRKGAEERRCSHQERDLEFSTNARHRLHVGRVSHSHNRAAFREVQERRHRKTKAMEQREFREHHVATAHVQNTSELLDVAHQVALRKFHTLRRTFRARAKHNHSIVVHVAMFHKHKANKPARHEDAKHKESSNLCLRDFLHDIFGIEQAHLVRSNLRVIVTTAFQLLHKLAARNHG